MNAEKSGLNFKYKSFHDQLDCDCPDLTKLKSLDIVAFRFVHKDSNHRNCSIPNRVINPKRTYKTCKKLCGAYALSFYETFQQAKENLEYFMENMPVLIEVSGDHIAECKLNPADGLADNTGHNGHFNFHEFEGTSFKNRFINSLKIVK